MIFAGLPDGVSALKVSVFQSKPNCGQTMLAVCSVLVFGEQKHLVIVNIFDNFCPVATASFIPCEDKTLSQFERVASPCLKITILIPILFQHNSFCYLSFQS